MLKDFIKFAKERFGLEVTASKSKDSDNFDKIFGSVTHENIKKAEGAS